MFKRILKFLLQNTFIAVVSTSLTFFIFLMMFIVIIVAVASKQKPLPKDALLMVDLTMNLVDTPPRMTLETMVQQAISDNETPEYNVRDLVGIIQRAKGDKRIKGLLLRGSFAPTNYGCTYPALSELRNALEDFKTCEKPIYAYSVGPSLRDMYVMSVADELYINHSGSVLLPGLYREAMYYKNAFEKFGIGVQAVRVGSYKSAVEPYTRSDMSDEAREATSLWMNSVWDKILGDIVVTREMDLTATRKIIDESPLLYAQDAVDIGLFDEALSHVEVVNRLVDFTGESKDDGSYKRIYLDEYVIEKDQLGKKPSGEGIAIVYAEGVIVGGLGEPYQAGADRIVSNLREARKNPDTKAIVLRVNSPGGGATASKIIQDELLEIKAQGIPLVVSMGGYAASGGYLISQSADRIYSYPHTITGSIGIFGLLFNFGEGAEKLGISFDDVKTSKNADILSISKPKSPEQIAIIQHHLNDFYDDWMETVADFRKQNEAHIRSIASGRVWAGEQAIKNGLVDELGGLFDAIEHAAELAKLETYDIYDYPRKLTPDEAITYALGLDNAAAAFSSKSQSTPMGQIRQVIETIQTHLNQFDDPNNTYTYFPAKYE